MTDSPSPQREPRASTTPIQEAWLTGVVVFGVGLLTRTRDIGGDDTVFAMVVEQLLRGRGLAPGFFDTYHMIHNPLVAAVTWLVRLLFPSALVLDCGAAVSSFFAALALAGFVFVMRREGITTLVALLAAGVVGTFGGVWSIATRMEVYTIAAAAVVLWLALAGGRKARPASVGLALAAAILAHAAMGLLIVPSLWRFRGRAREMLIVTGVGLGLPGLALAVLFVLVHGAWNPLLWPGMFFPAESAGFLHPESILLAPSAFVRLLLWNWYRAVPVLTPAAMHALDVMGWLAVLLAAGIGAFGLRVARLRGGHVSSLTLTALLAFLPLWLVWDVGNPEHLVATAPLFGVLLAFGASGAPRRTGAAALAALFGLLLVVNGIGGAALQRRPENGRMWVTASFVTQTVPDSALILSVGTDARIRMGLGYLSGRRVLDLTLVLRSFAGRPVEDGLSYWLSQAEEAGELWALDELFRPETESWVQERGIPAVVWRRVLTRFVSAESVELEADGAVVREPFRIHRLERVGAG